MSQKLSVIQSPYFVRNVLMGYRLIIARKFDLASFAASARPSSAMSDRKSCDTAMTGPAVATTIVDARDSHTLNAIGGI